jgi:hypothetical protein
MPVISAFFKLPPGNGTGGTWVIVPERIHTHKRFTVEQILHGYSQRTPMPD